MIKDLMKEKAIVNLQLFIDYCEPVANWPHSIFAFDIAEFAPFLT